MKVPFSNEQDPIHLPIHLRCFAKVDGGEAGKTPQARRKKVGPSEVTLTFDTETTTDAPQRLRILFYQLQLRGRLDEEGAAYDPDALSARELATLKRYCVERALPPPITVDVFRQQVFLEKAYACGAEIIGLNLAFDLARIAIDASPARVTSWRRKMRGAFTLKLSEDSRWPNLQIKHLNSRAAIYEFTAPGRQFASRSDRRRERRLRSSERGDGGARRSHAHNPAVAIPLAAPFWNILRTENKVGTTESTADGPMRSGSGWRNHGIRNASDGSVGIEARG